MIQKVILELRLAFGTREVERWEERWRGGFRGGEVESSCERGRWDNMKIDNGDADTAAAITQQAVMFFKQKLSCVPSAEQESDPGVAAFAQLVKDWLGNPGDITDACHAFNRRWGPPGGGKATMENRRGVEVLCVVSLSWAINPAGLELRERHQSWEMEHARWRDPSGTDLVPVPVCIVWMKGPSSSAFEVGDRVRYRDNGREWRTGVVRKVVDGRPRMPYKPDDKDEFFFDEVEHSGGFRVPDQSAANLAQSPGPPPQGAARAPVQ
eukprot:gene57313-biopygen46840